MTNKAIVFTSRGDGGWQGNGYGTTSNSYAVMVGSKIAGMLCKDCISGWRYYQKTPTYIAGVLFDYEKHPSASARTFHGAKQAVRALLSHSAD